MKLYKKFKVRIPRKLKKAAKYGITHNVQHRTTNTDGRYNVLEVHSWTIQGRSTKWKVKATYKCAAEYKRMLNEEMLSWLNRRQDEEEILAELKKKVEYFRVKVPDIPYNPSKFHFCFDFTKGGEQ